MACDSIQRTIKKIETASSKAFSKADGNLEVTVQWQIQLWWENICEVGMGICKDKLTSTQM